MRATMAERLIRKACDRFRAELTPDQVQQIQSLGRLDDIKHALHQVERELTARQALRGFGRLAPFINALEHYAKAIEVACNGTPFMPWIWAPIKLVILAIQESTSCLDKMLSAYAKIGQRMPRFARYAGVFPNDSAFQHLLACLFEDIVEFHRKSFELIRRPGWKLFFAPLWGRFHSRFDELLDNISFISDEIDREAISIDIVQTQDSRQKEQDENLRREERLQAEQVAAVMGWLASDIIEQEDRLEWLRGRCHDGTSCWITNHKEFRSWLQLGRGRPVLWLNGKPGSGKSVISASVVAFLRNAKRRVAYYICNYQTPPTNITAHILRSICAQVITMMPEFIPYTFDECIANGQAPSATCLSELLCTFLGQVTDLRLVFDGLDEVQSSEHRKLINDIMRLTKGPNSSCRILFISQDVPTIHGPLSKVPAVRLCQEIHHINKDLDLVIQMRLHEIDEQNEGMLGPHHICTLKNDILARSEGMFLWVHLILELLMNASSIAELKSEVASVPKDLTALYVKILNRIKTRSGDDFGKIRRVFSWLLCHKGGDKIPLSKYTVRIAMAVHPGRRVLTYDDVPFIHAVDICKPLIEDGPNGSITFIHSTVATFLVQEESGPFLCLQDARVTVTYACIAHLLQSFQLVSATNATDSLLPVARFVYGFLPYANRFWYDHLSQCAERSLPEALRHLVVELCATYRELAPPKRTAEPSTGQSQAPEAIFQGLLEADAKTLKELISYVTTNHSSDNDNNPMTTAIEAHQLITRKLLLATDMSELPKEVLLQFKDTVGSTAFTCATFDCPRSVVGYPTQCMLQQHSLTHGPPLRCFEGCKLNDVGFTSVKSLKSHKRKYHGEHVPEIPRKFQWKHDGAATAKANEEEEYGKKTKKIEVQLKAGIVGQKTNEDEEEKKAKDGADEASSTATAMPGQQIPDGPEKNTVYAQQLLLVNGISPSQLTPQQFQQFQNQPPHVQIKSIQAYSQNLQQNHGLQMSNKQAANPNAPQGQGSPMMGQAPDGTNLNVYYHPGEMGGAGPSSLALQEYQMKLKLLEQPDLKRRMIARQEQDSMGNIPRADGQPGPASAPGHNGQGSQDTSPQAARIGTSPNPSEQTKRDPPQMNSAGIPLPLLEGTNSRGSPNPMNFMPYNIDPNMNPKFFKPNGQRHGAQ
ncbi:uncharacterized protein B0I36DRAFT_337764 [Microdochium trichocladiopsis]|uniref:NACHT domain-containing protein n=1 Tax=Microdochium trichocladiopsis TaxID=1682393 RepID=A0A9P9BGW1_9PEZI|nr:uncharacterized protein B0I36DRAFT_337764 [Microdochium trichocladiopsis]KAH7016462.1 hypothetical protein B0I36DRAFT_337764 [Microdochium trichocladiopsis]